MQRASFPLLTMAALAALAACSRPAPLPERHQTEASRPHIVDEGGAPVTDADSVWPVLIDTFGAAVPERVTVRRVATGTSRFDAEHDVILISAESLHGRPERSVIAHETAHISLARMTNGASMQEPFRFLDRGSAGVVEVLR